MLSEDHPLALGARLHHDAARRFLETESDVVLAIGTELAESDLLDWVIRKPYGSEEGNVVGKFLDTYNP